MNKVSKLSFNLDECKTKATILHKALHSEDLTQLTDASTRFRCLPLFSNSKDSDIIGKAQHKHALNVIAIENGFDSWANLKTYFEKTKLTNFILHSGFLNQWFAKYKEAKEYLTTNKHNSQLFLLPYKNQFLVCDANCIEYMGLQPDNPDWNSINYNWAEPGDIKVWERLNQMHRLRGVK